MKYMLIVWGLRFYCRNKEKSRVWGVKILRLLFNINRYKQNIKMWEQQQQSRLHMSTSNLYFGRPCWSPSCFLYNMQFPGIIYWTRFLVVLIGSEISVFQGSYYAILCSGFKSRLSWALGPSISGSYCISQQHLELCLPLMLAKKPSSSIIKFFKLVKTHITPFFHWPVFHHFEHLTKNKYVKDRASDMGHITLSN